MEKSLVFISLWVIIVIFFLMRKSLAPFMRWRNLFILLGVTAFYLWWDCFSSSYRIVDALNVLFPGAAYPFHDSFSTQIVVILYEEIIRKGIPIFLFLLLLRVFNKGKSMKWVVIFVPLYIVSLFSLFEAMGYMVPSVPIMNKLGRILMPQHFDIQIVMGYVLYRYCKTHRWYYMPFFAIGAPIGMHLLHNFATYMPTEITVYMAANEHYDFLYYFSMICFLVAIGLYYVYSFWVGLSLLSQQEGNFLWSRKIRCLDSWFQKLFRKKVYLLVVSVLVTGGCMGTAIYFYENQEVKPTIFMPAEEKNIVWAKEDSKNYNACPVDSLPMIPLIESGQIKPHKLLNPPMKFLSFPLSNTPKEMQFYLRIYSYRGFIIYKNVVVGITLQKNILSVNELQIIWKSTWDIYFKD